MQTVKDDVTEPQPVETSGDFDAFYQHEYPKLCRLAYVLTGSRGTAEDLTQETLLRALRHWDRVGTYDRPDAWARKILMNLATSRGRRLVSEARALLRLRSERTHSPTVAPDHDIAVAIRKLPAFDAHV